MGFQETEHSAAQSNVGMGALDSAQDGWNVIAGSTVGLDVFDRDLAEAQLGVVRGCQGTAAGEVQRALGFDSAYGYLPTGSLPCRFSNKDISVYSRLLIRQSRRAM